MISVSGIGPVSALAIIAADDNAGLVQAIEQKNITYLTKFPKIGKKTAQQMVLDLEGKVVATGAPAESKVSVQTADNLRVTPEVVEKEIGVSKDFNAFELRNAKKYKN